MTKVCDVKTPQVWTTLDELAGEPLVGVIELFNAGREGGVDILWTESAEQPVMTDFCRLLKRQKSVVITVGTQPIWIMSELQKAKLMISKPNSATITLEGKI